MKPVAICFCTAVMVCLSACDDGRIYDEGDSVISGSGFTVTVDGEITGSSDYRDDSKYSVVIAAFKDGDSFAVVSKRVSDGSGPQSLENITGEVSTVELCVINRLRERVFTFVSEPVAENHPDEIRLDVGKINVGKFQTISDKVFSASCTQCHGATGHSAAGLDLMPEEAYAMLVNVPSVVIDGDMRVLPSDASSSTLWKAVATNVSADWAFNHANLLTIEQSGFIENWINSGADD